MNELKSLKVFVLHVPSPVANCIAHSSLSWTGFTHHQVAFGVLKIFSCKSILHRPLDFLSCWVWNARLWPNFVLVECSSFYPPLNLGPWLHKCFVDFTCKALMEWYNWRPAVLVILSLHSEELSTIFGIILFPCLDKFILRVKVFFLWLLAVFGLLCNLLTRGCVRMDPLFILV